MSKPSSVTLQLLDFVLICKQGGGSSMREKPRAYVAGWTVWHLSCTISTTSATAATALPPCLLPNSRQARTRHHWPPEGQRQHLYHSSSEPVLQEWLTAHHLRPHGCGVSSDLLYTHSKCKWRDTPPSCKAQDWKLTPFYICERITMCNTLLTNLPPSVRLLQLPLMGREFQNRNVISPSPDLR
jgi:hypothetical protein